MTRRKGENHLADEERDNPHIVEMVVPPFGFGTTLNVMYELARQCSVTSKQGATWRNSAGDHVRWCFAMADAFAKRFGGRRLPVVAK